MSYERRDYAAVAGKQQFSIARTKLPPLVIAKGNGLIYHIILLTGPSAYGRLCIHSLSPINLPHYPSDRPRRIWKALYSFP